IEVKGNRPGITVRARRGYVAPKAKASTKNNAPSNASPEMADALNSPLPVTGLGMKLFVAPFKGTAPNASVLMGVEMQGRDLRLADNSKLVMSFVAVDAKGKSYGARSDSLTLNLKPETR